MSKFFGMIRDALSKETDPNKVTEVLSKNYADLPIWRREDGMLMYQVKSKSEQGVDTLTYEIVILSNKDEKFFSVLRSSNEREAVARLENLKKIVPHFLSARPELYNVGSLQKLCDAVKDHPDWGLCHIAVLLDLVDLVAQEDGFKRELDVRDSAGLTALMVAVNDGSKHKVAGLVAQGASLTEGCDITGSNVMHYVARRTVSLLDIIAAGEKYDKSTDTIVKLLNTRNNNNMTPLHLACEDDKPDMVRAMLSLGADLNILAETPGESDNPDVSSKRAKQSDNSGFKEVILEFPKSLYTKDIKHGGTPLHWATDKPFMEALVGLDCDIEARNKLGHTALVTAVLYQRLSCQVCLLSHGAKVDSPDPQGNTPLHLAVEKAHLPSIQALLVFGADWNIKNKVGDTAWMVALKTNQSKFTFKDVDLERNMVLHTLHSIGAEGPTDLSPTTKEFDWKPPVTDKNRLHKRCRHLFDDFLDTSAANAEVKPGSVSVLSLDGGGIKGLVLTKILGCLAIQSGLRVTEMFSWITGTSTGGILSLALAVGLSPLEAQCMYFKLKDKVFVGNRPYEVEPMEKFLKEVFKDQIMTDLPKKPHIAVTGTLADRYPADLHFFRNYTSPMDLLNIREELLTNMSPTKKPDQQSVWRAARSSGAAPTYFRASGRYIDGGLVANNPTLDILTEIHERNSALRCVDRAAEVEKVGVVISLGTGDPPVERVDHVDLFRPDSVMAVPQLLFGMNAMGRLLVDQASSSVNRVVDRARAWCDMAGISYFRLSPLLASDINLDETRDEVLVEMLWMTQAYMHEQRQKVKEMIEILKKCSPPSQK